MQIGPPWSLRGSQTAGCCKLTLSLHPQAPASTTNLTPNTLASLESFTTLASGKRENGERCPDIWTGELEPDAGHICQTLRLTRFTKGTVTELEFCSFQQNCASYNACASSHPLILMCEGCGDDRKMRLALGSFSDLTSSPSSSMDKQMVHFSSTSVSSSSPIFSCRGFLCSQVRLHRPGQKSPQPVRLRGLILAYLLVFVRKGEPLYGGLNGSSAHTPQSVLQLQQLLRDASSEMSKWVMGGDILNQSPCRFCCLNR